MRRDTTPSAQPEVLQPASSVVPPVMQPSKATVMCKESNDTFKTNYEISAQRNMSGTFALSLSLFFFKFATIFKNNIGNMNAWNVPFDVSHNTNYTFSPYLRNTLKMSRKGRDIDHTRLFWSLTFSSASGCTSHRKVSLKYKGQSWRHIIKLQLLLLSPHVQRWQTGKQNIPNWTHRASSQNDDALHTWNDWRDSIRGG